MSQPAAAAVVVTTTTNPIHDFFHGLKVSDIIAEKKITVISLKTKDTIEAAIKTLSKNKILSAPVVNEKNECVGFVDVLDILKHITKAAPNDLALQQSELQSLKIAGRAISLVLLENVCDFSGRDPLLTAQLHDTASSLLPYFAKGFHRAAVYDKANLVGVISQSDYVRVLSKNLHMGKLKEIGQQSLKQLGYASAEVVNVKASQRVIDVLRLMVEKGYGQVPVVDDNSGNLCANFSASDVRGLYQEEFPHLLDPVGDYLTKFSPNSLNPSCTLPSSTLIDTVNELASSHLHHLWNISMRPPFKPVSVISLTDIMKIAVAKY